MDLLIEPILTHNHSEHSAIQNESKHFHRFLIKRKRNGDD